MVPNDIQSPKQCATAEALKIKAIRDGEDDLLCVEADGAFLEMLRRVQRTPMGALANLAAADEEEDNPFSRLQASMDGLRARAFRVGDAESEGAIADNMNVDLRSLINGTKAPTTALDIVTTNNLERSPRSIPCRLTTEGTAWTEGVAFRGVGESFEVAIEHDTNSVPYVMLGVLPDDDDLVQKMQAGSSSYNMGCFLYINGTEIFNTYPNPSQISLPRGSGGAEIRMRFKSSPHFLLEYCLNKGAWSTYPQSKINQFLPSPLSKCCPAILLNRRNNNNSLTITEVSGSAQMPPVLSSGDKSYLITKNLEVLETGSFGRTIQLLQRFRVSDLSDLRVRDDRFGREELKRLIKAVVRGEQNLLSEALPSVRSGSAAKADVADDADTASASISGRVDRSRGELPICEAVDEKF